jgi:TolB protein
VNKKLSILLFVLILAAVSLSACSGLGGAAPTPTITAIPLPTEASRFGVRPGSGAGLAAATATLSPQAAGPGPRAASPTTTSPQAVVPTTTPSAPPVATSVQPTATLPLTTATPALNNTVAPTPTNTATPTVPPPTATQEPAKPTVRPTPRPTPTPQWTGKLVFQTALGGELYVINADGTGLRRLTDGIDPSWSPDGKQIAFTRYRDPRGVWVINADGSGARLVFAWSQARWTSWSPDGSLILFTRVHGGTGEQTRCFHGFCFTRPAEIHWRLGTVNENNGSFNEPPSPLLSLSPYWSPGGDRLVYAGDHGLAVQNVDGSNVYNISNDADDIDPVWSPAGTNPARVVFTRRQHDHWELYAVDASGANLVRLTDTPLHPDGTAASSVAAAWSPDGRYIAFYTDRTGKWEIWIMKADGSGQQPMFGKALDGLTLSYSFDGDRALSWTR